MFVLFFVEKNNKTFVFFMRGDIDAVSVTIIACSFACFVVLQMLRGSQFLIVEPTLNPVYITMCIMISYFVILHRF